MTSVFNDLVLTGSPDSEGRLPGASAALARLVKTTSDIYVLVDRHQRIRYLNPAAESLLGMSAAESKSIGADLSDWFSGLDIYSIQPGDQVIVHACVPAVRLVVLSVFQLAGGAVQLLLANDSEPLKTHQQLRHQSELLRLTCSAALDGFIACRADGGVEFANPAACQLLAISDRDRLPDTLEALLMTADKEFRAKVIGLLHTSLEANCAQQLLMGLRVSGRDVQMLLVQASPLQDSVGPPGGILLTLRREEFLAVSDGSLLQPSHDTLTQLPSRQVFEAAVTQALDEVQDGQQSHGLLLIDLYHFKLINDTCGHIGGDELLRQLAVLLHGKLRSRDLLARMGSDEFGILLHDCTLAGIQRFADNLLRAIQSYRFCWDEREIKVSISVGAVTVDQTTESVSQLLSNANAACSLARESGRNKIYFYKHDSLSSEHREQINWVVRINEALADNRLELYQQAVLPLRPGQAEVPHFEVLLRMQSESGDMVGPGMFIPAAERYGLMDDIDCWVVERVMQCLQARERAGLPDCSYAVNLSGVSIGDSAFADFVISLFGRYQFRPGLLHFEVTETAAVRHLECAVNFMNLMRERGCRFYLDDFGSGLSSFGYLKELPVDYLKIDGSFVASMLENESSFAMVSTFNHLAHVMNLQTVAEYVENDALRQRLQEMGVDYGQGYGLMRPEPLLLP